MCSSIDVLAVRRSVPMDLSSASTYRVRGRDLGSEKDRRLQGNVLVLARVVWLALAAFSLALLVTSLPSYVGRLQSVCAGTACAHGQLNLSSMRTLHDFG